MMFDLRACLHSVLRLCILVPFVLGQAPYDLSPFDVLGTINGMSVDTAGGPLAGGSITVDGMVITVPANLLATLPSITVAWPELFTGDIANLPGSVSWEAHVQGNRVAGKNIAGLIFISQKFSQRLQGFISSIDISTGHFTIGASNIDCVLNDPIGRYGIPQTGQELWTSDPDNPSIRATNGFPVCIPRTASDPLCPSKNRPKDTAGKLLTSFTFKDPATIGPNDPDPNQMVPLAVGDFVDISGTEISGTLWVNNLNANLGIYTAPGTKPAYVTCEEALFGIVTTQADVEFGETRAVAFTTDVGGGLLDWFAIDVDPCTGVVTERTLNVAMQPNSALQPLGRAVYRTPAKLDLTPATRSVGFRLKSGTSTGAGNLTAGAFIQPIFDYTFPELLDTGAAMPVNAFDTIPYLAKGSGPYVPGKPGANPPETPIIVGQLNPWPGAVKPAAASCPPVAPSPPPTSPTSTTLNIVVSPTPAPTGKPPVDTIVVTNAVGKNQKGSTTVTILATTTSKDPTIMLFLTAAGQNPVGKTNMTLVTPGSWQLVFTVKSKPTSVTLTSSFGGGPVTANVN